MNNINDRIAEAPPFDYDGGAEGVLKVLLQSGMISMDDVTAEMKKAEMKAIVDTHPYAIFECSGRWMTHVKDSSRKEGRRQLTRKKYDDLISALVEFYKEHDSQEDRRLVTLEQLYPEWLEHKKSRTNRETYIKRIERMWKAYYEGSSFVQIPLRNMEPIIIEDWAHNLVKKHGMTRKEYSNCVLILKHAMKYAVSKKYIETSIYSPVQFAPNFFPKTKEKPADTQVFFEDEIEQIVDLAWKDFENPRGNRKHVIAPLVVPFMYHTGVRGGEALGLRYEDISDDGNWLHVHGFYDYEVEKCFVEGTKGKKDDRYVPLTTEAKNIINATKKKKEELGLSADGFIFSINDNPLPYYALKYLFEHVCKVIETPNKSSHKARKTYCTALYESGMSLKDIQELAGHTDSSVTYDSYVFSRTTKEQKRAQVEAALSCKKDANKR